MVLRKELRIITMKKSFKPIFSNKPLLSRRKDWIITYVVLLLIPVVFNYISYFYTQAVLAQKTQDVRLLALENSQNYMDNVMNSIASANVTMASDDTLNNLANQSDILSITGRYELQKLNSIWNMHNVVANDIEQKFVYFPKSNSVYLNSSLSTVDNCYNLLFNNNYTSNVEPTFSVTDFKEKLLTLRHPQFVVANVGSEAMLFFAYPVSKHFSGTASFNIIVKLNLNHMLFQAQNYNGTDCFIITPDENIVHNNLSPDELAVVSDMPAYDKHLTIKRHNGQKYVVVRTQSASNDLSYGTVIPYNEYKKNLAETRSMTHICNAFCILLGLLLIKWLLKENYTPLKLISEKINHYTKSSPKENIYASISEAITRTQSNHRRTLDILDEQSSILKSSVLSNILHGNTKDKFSYAEQLKMANINMPENMYSIIIVAPENKADGIFSSHEKIDITDNARLSYSTFIIGNICLELINENFNAEMLINSESVAFIVNHDSDGEDFKKQVEDILNTASSIIEKEFDFRVLIAVSNPQSPVDNIPIAYNEAVLCLEFLNDTQDNFMFYEDIISHKQGFPLDISAFRKDIDTALSKQNYTKCRDIIKSTIKDIQQSELITPETARIFARDILKVLMHSNLVNASDKTKSLLLSVEYDRIMSQNNTTVSNILLNTMNIADAYLKDHIEIDDEKSKKNYDFIKEYIDTNFSSPTLSVASIASRFDINAAYLSTQFKAAYNIGVLEYIRQVRIEKAKELLKATDMKNEEIYSYVGYTNSRTFIRAFQKVEGVTPKEFRTINK